MPQDTVASLALKLKWISQQLVRDLPSLSPAERRAREEELAQAEKALREAEDEEAAE